MAAEQHPAIGTMPPSATILQLDTTFPRIPGDIGCPDTYCADVEIVRIAGATVQHVVNDRPDQINITPFEEALEVAQGDIVATSCGFLSYWQNHLSARTPKPFVSSALTGLSKLRQKYLPKEVMIVTFDADSLSDLHFGDYPDFRSGIVGLSHGMHLRDVIENGRETLDPKRAGAELVQHICAAQMPEHRHILLECTNLPPYKAELFKETGLPITDVLTEIEERRHGTITPAFLVGHAG